MELEVVVAGAPFDIPGVIAQVWEGSGVFFEIYPEDDGTFRIEIWPQGAGPARVLPLEEFQAAIAFGVNQLKIRQGLA